MGRLSGGTPSNYKSQNRKGIARNIESTGAPFEWDVNRRPSGTPNSQPDTDKAEREVEAYDRQKFQEGQNINRNSVYDQNTSGTSEGRRGPRSRTGSRGVES